MNDLGDVHLYDRVARLEEQLGPKALGQLRPRIEGEDGEARFTHVVQEHVTPDDVVVDIGTGAGVWLLEAVAPVARRVIGLDYARGRYRLALSAKGRLGTVNADFLLADGRALPLRDGAADAVTNRRGPWDENEQFFAEGCRILRRGGLGLAIGIGEQNARELDAAFGERAQMHSWFVERRDRLADEVALSRSFGLEPIVAEQYLATESFPSREALMYRLETSPTIDAFDPEGDGPLVDKVMAEHGLRLTVHRFVIVAQKAN